MKELWQTITNTYNNYRGTGKLLALFLVSVLIIYLLNIKEQRENYEAGRKENSASGVSPLVFVLSPISGIAYAFTRLYRRIFLIPTDKKRTDIKHTWIYPFLAAMCIVLTLILSGRWIFTSDDHYMAENRMHIKQEYVNVFMALLSTEDGDIRICSTPEISTYMRMYSPRLDVMFVRPVNGDASILKGDVRAVYDQMSMSTPDEGRVVEMLRDNGYDHILYNEKGTYWNLPLEEFGYELILKAGDYRVYRDAKEPF